MEEEKEKMEEGEEEGGGGGGGGMKKAEAAKQVMEELFGSEDDDDGDVEMEEKDEEVGGGKEGEEEEEEEQDDDEREEELRETKAAGDYASGSGANDGKNVFMNRHVLRRKTGPELDLKWEELGPHERPEKLAALMPSAAELTQFRPSPLVCTVRDEYDRGSHKIECSILENYYDCEHFTPDDVKPEDVLTYMPHVNKIRYRRKPGIDTIDTLDQIESNARLVVWEDGSASIAVGDELLKVDFQGRTAAPGAGEKVVATKSQTKRSSLLRRAGSDPSGPYARALYSQGDFDTKLSVQPSSLTSNSHMKLMQMKMKRRVVGAEDAVGEGITSGKKLITTNIIQDPEQENREREVALQKQIKDRYVPTNTVSTAQCIPFYTHMCVCVLPPPIYIF